MTETQAQPGLHLAHKWVQKYQATNTEESNPTHCQKKYTGQKKSGQPPSSFHSGNGVRCCWSKMAPHTFGNTITRNGDIVQFYAWFMVEDIALYFGGRGLMYISVMFSEPCEMKILDKKRSWWLHKNTMMGMQLSRAGCISLRLLCTWLGGQLRCSYSVSDSERSGSLSSK